MIFHPACLARTKRGLAFGAASARFVVRGCKHGVSSQSKQSGLHQNTSSGSAKAPRTASRLRRGLVRVSSWIPRRALEIQPYRVVGQCAYSKLRAHLLSPTSFGYAHDHWKRDVFRGLQGSAGATSSSTSISVPGNRASTTTWMARARSACSPSLAGRAIARLVPSALLQIPNRLGHPS